MIESPQRATAFIATDFHAARITVTAGSDTLAAGMPIIIKDSEFAGPISLATAIMFDETTPLPTQYDAGLGELVFQLPSAIAASGSYTFEMNASASGASNGQSPTILIGQGDYSTTYGSWLPSWDTSTFMNGSKLSSMVEAIGDVIWVDTDWGTLSLMIDSQWRQGTWRNVVMKDANWDVVTASHNASINGGPWRWGASLFQDADEGWQRQFSPDTVMIKKVGPVRAVIKVIANADWKDNLGQSVQNVNATRTYTLYNGFPGIAQHFTITGTNATQAMADFRVLNPLGEPLGMKHQFMDGRYNVHGSNNLTKIFVPSSSVYTRAPGPITLSSMTDSYFAVYNETDMRGWLYNWGPFVYKDNVSQIEANNEVVINCAFDKWPTTGLNRFWVPFSSYNGTISSHAASLNTMWTAAYTVSVTEYAPNQPNAPQTLQAVSGHNFVDLSWIAPSSDGGSPITVYKVYRATTSGAPYTLQGTTTSLSFSDTSVTNEVTYYYVVTAVNNVGESAYSTEVSATPTTPLTSPSAPQSLQATSSDSTVDLSWITPSSDGGSPITVYKVYRATTSGAPYTLQGTTTSLSFSDTSVTNGVTYYYVVTAVNNVGESIYSAEASATPSATTTTTPVLSTGFELLFVALTVLGISVISSQKRN